MCDILGLNLNEKGGNKMAFKGYYFKRGDGLISGINLPDKVEGENFICCVFHPNCDEIKFINCDFQDCDGVKYLKLIDCKISIRKGN